MQYHTNLDLNSSRNLRNAWRHHLQFLVVAALLCATSSLAQTPTVALNDQAIIQPNTKRVGLNIGAIDYWDSGQVLKNLIGSINPGFEPLMAQQIAPLLVSGSSTTFTDPDQWDGVPPNYWAGGTFTVVASQSGGKELGCTGTIASNTGPNYPAGSVSTYTYPVYTISNPCAAPFAVGDIVVLSKTTIPTPEAWWESSEAGIWASISGGGKLTSNTTDLCATCGTQTLKLDATASGSSAGLASYYDAAPALDMFVLMNGTYQISFWAKVASGSPTLSVSASRNSAGGFNCGTQNPSLTNTWALYTLSCTASETPKTTKPGLASVQIRATNGAVYLDNLSFEKTATDPTNTTVFRDEVFNAFKNFYNTQSGGNPGMLRDWLNQNAENVQNWTSPDYAQKPTASGHGNFVGPVGNGAVTLSLEDYLNLCKALHAEPYLEVPVTISTQDAANLIEFLAGPSSSQWGGQRTALGQSEAWTSVFDTIHLSYCNECWNGSSFSGQALPSRNGAPNSEYYYDYSVRAKSVFAAMRSNAYYSQQSFDLVMNAQTAVNYSMDTAIARAHPDSIEIEGYTYGNVSSFSTDTALWQPLDAENYGRFVNPSDPTNFYQSVHDYESLDTCGATGSNPCHVNVYEFGSGSLAGTIDQTHLDYIDAGAGTGVFFPLLSLLNQQYYNVNAESYFALAEYQNNSDNGNAAKVWGISVDMGGATNNMRPQYLGLSLVNQSMIGPMYDCPISNNITYNFAGSPTNGTNTATGVPAIKDVPNLYAFCFENGNNRSMVLINTDLSSSHTVAFSGTNVPAGSVTERQYAPSSLDLLNESPSGTSSSTSTAAVALTSTTVSNPSSLTLPPHSVTALDFTASGGTVPSPAATPVFSVSAGSYSAAQTVSISDGTEAATIYFSTDGTTPTTASSVYSSPITVGTSETLQAIAIASGYTTSSMASATYTITIPAAAAPSFSPAQGTYTTSQTVAISDATAAAVVYYTMDGSTPTTSSAVYGAPLVVSSTSTLKAIAIATGFNASAPASATYTINLPAPSVPVFSPAGGTYTANQQVTLADATPGAVIYYATNGSSSSANWTQYTGPLTVSSTQALSAMAVMGSAPSSPVTANYVITTPLINYSNGFNASNLQVNGNASLNNGLLQLTPKTANQIGTAWYTTAVPVSGFTTDFTFQVVNGVADGFTFAIQNSAAGYHAAGGDGGALGYRGIKKSVAVKFDFYHASTTGVYLNGGSPQSASTDMTAAGINFCSGDVFKAHLVYSAGTLIVTVTDTVNGSQFSQSYQVDIPTAVGSSTAYVGFTGATGAESANQQVISWLYSSNQ